MADFDFLEGFESDGDWGFSSVAEKPSERAQSDSETTKAVVKQTADGVGKAVSKEVLATIEVKLDKIYSAINSTKSEIKEKNETELEITKKQLDDEYDLRKDNLGKEQKEKFAKLEKLIIPLLIKLAKSPEDYIFWPNPNRENVIEGQLKKIIEITRN